MKNLWRAMKLVLPQRKMLALYMLTAIGLALCGAAPFVLVKSFLDKLVDVPPRDKLSVFVDGVLVENFGSGRGYIYALCAITFVVWALKALFDFLNSYISSWLAQHLRMEAMQSVMRKLLSLDQPYFDRQKTGDLVSRMVSDGDNLRKTVKIFLDFMRQPPQVAALAAYGLYLDWRLFCLGAIGVPLVFLPLSLVIRNITRQTRKYQEKTADLAQAMLQNLSGIRIIHAYDAAAKESENFGQLAHSLFRTGLRRNLNRALQHPMTELMMGLGMVVVMLVGGLAVRRTPGANPTDFIVFVGALSALYMPLRAMMGTLGELAEFLPSAERTFEVLDVKPTISERPGALPCPVLAKEIVFENVSFDYGRGPVLKNLNLSIAVG